MIYHSPKSSVLTNNTLSESFSLHQGVRQGDCLSPLLFNIALKPLAHPHIKGISAGTSERLVTLYVDDLLVTLINPEVGTPYLLKYVELFSKISGYTINWDKSELVLIGENTILHDCPFKIAHDHITYFGIKISKNPKRLFKLNLFAGLDRLKRILDFVWGYKKHRLSKKINADKSSVRASAWMSDIFASAWMNSCLLRCLFLFP
uniref:Reverse transcriptase domain-containing protein n=1 Tax=Labrus bergylta TaxID=56723 RepID=A0A3Q3FZY8_9LABR